MPISRPDGLLRQSSTHPPADEVIVRKRPARRVVEFEEDEDVAPRVEQEEECVTRRTKVYDPRSKQTVVRRERDCR